MNILSINEKEILSKISDLVPSYLYMSSQTAELLDKSVLHPQITGYIGNYLGIPVHIDNSLSIGKIIFGVE